MAESFAELRSPGILPIKSTMSILVEASAAISDTLLILLGNHSIDAVSLTTEQAVYCMELPESCTFVLKSQNRATIWSVDVTSGTCDNTHGMVHAYLFSFVESYLFSGQVIHMIIHFSCLVIAFGLVRNFIHLVILLQLSKYVTSETLVS